MPVVGLLDVGVDAERGELLTVCEKFDLLLTTIGRDQRQVDLLEEGLGAKDDGALGERPMRTKIGPRSIH